MASESVAKGIDLSREMLGEHPEDVIAIVQAGAERLAQMAILFRAIEKKADPVSEIKQLASLGSYVADDTANFMDDRHEHFTAALKRFMEA